LLKVNSYKNYKLETNTDIKDNKKLTTSLNTKKVPKEIIYPDEDKPELDFQLAKDILLKSSSLTDKDLQIIFNDLKLKKEPNKIKKKDLITYIEKKKKGEKTFINKNKHDNYLKIETLDFNDEEPEDDIKKLDEADNIKNILKQDPPNFNKLKDFNDYLKIWKIHEPNIRKIIFGIRRNPVSYADVLIVHKEIALVLSEKRLFSDAFKDCLIRYVKCVWKKNDPKSYEDIYQEIYDLLPLSDLSSVKNIKELKKVFEASNKEIIRDILECPGITLTKKEVEDLHKKIITGISDSNYPFFERLKKSLIHYKKAGDEKDLDTLMRQWNNIMLIVEMEKLHNLKDINKAKEFFSSVKILTKKNLINILNLEMNDIQIDELHKLIENSLTHSTPYYEELLQLLSIYLDSIANKHVIDIHSCKNEFYNIAKRTDEIMKYKKKIISFSNNQTKEDLFTSWKNDERHLMYIANDLDGLIREKLKNFHNEIYHTFACNITSFFEMRKQLSTYTETISKGDVKEIKSAMKNFMSFMRKENANEEHRVEKQSLNSTKEPPDFKSFKDKKKFFEEWTSFINLPTNKKLFTIPECPINKMKIVFLNTSIKATLANKETDFEWFKSLVQSLVNNIFLKEFTRMLENYNAVNQYIPGKVKF